MPASIHEFLTVLVLIPPRKCDHSAYNLCLQLLRRTCAGESPLPSVRGCRAAYLPFGVPPSPSLPQDEPPTARGRSVAPAGAAGHTAPNRRRNPARGEEPVRLAEASAGGPSPAATLSRHGRRSHRTALAPCLPRTPFRIRASQRFRSLCISIPCVPPQGARRARSPKPAPPRFCYGPGCKPTTRHPPSGLGYGQ